ncbi:hypothetical protein [Grimontia hollisae]|uniref:Uncharacterized protein n=3 Tax=Grimontia hollisae TaxID=673 RepID=D0I6Y2_GRIHO|nr:hypothetical protein [Grimontia hollisae]EEY72401.1 hypothetical protein VHA_001501 [Grimontia hollisae CIP 101886]MDF2185787.1 hypothetical protein [Grimontia hollisae]STO45675.1 Uncharacterised protein [Grimontia hollisae]STO57986.1 Uncharacterised protein [Grimontia hollisae]STQ76496.1 Uncharacterised protein [Grimontia hollisae]
MGHRRISNKKMKQMLQEVLPDGIRQGGKSGALVEGKEQKDSHQDPLLMQDQQK